MLALIIGVGLRTFATFFLPLIVLALLLVDLLSIDIFDANAGENKELEKVTKTAKETIRSQCQYLQKRQIYILNQET